MLDYLTNHLLPSIGQFHIIGYWIGFFAAFLETIIGVGLFLPGSSLILILGALSARGYLDTGDLLWFSIIGAILGDNANYYLGRRYGARWLKHGFWFLKAEHVEKASSFMNEHGAKGVFLGRFIPSVKEIVPFIAGSLKMNKTKFMLFNILGAIGWGLEWVFAGYIFARALNLAELWLSRAGIFFTFLILLVAFFYLCKWVVLKKGKKIATVLLSLWISLKEAVADNEHVSLWMQRHPRCVSFLQGRLDRRRFTGLNLTILTLAFFYVMALFAGIVEDLITSDPIVSADIRIANLVSAFRTPAIIRVFTWITLLGKSEVILAFFFISVIILWLWGKRYSMISLLVSVSGSVAFTSVSKLLFHRPRPAVAVYIEHSYSFPSGHATIAVAFYGLIGCLLIQSVATWKRKVNIFFATVVLIVAIGLSRIYLGVHYVSDVWAGYLVGSIWLIAGFTFEGWLKSRSAGMGSVMPHRAAWPVSVILVTLGLGFYLLFSLNYHPQKRLPGEEKGTVVSDYADVFTGEQLKYTETIFGERQEPLNLIFLADNDRVLKETLKQMGWVMTDRPGLSTFYRALKSLALKLPYPSAPVSPSFWNGRIQDMSFSKVTGKNWLVNARHLRIWRTRTMLEKGKNIYVGLINRIEGLRLGIIPEISPDLDSEREKICNDFRKVFNTENIKMVQIVIPQTGKNFIG
ncbi:MAG: phosphatase PAP2 family protein, partial [Nitrospirae bacterium]